MSKTNRVYIGGTFDLTHFGHYQLFFEASMYGDVWVSLNTDEFAEEYKRKPILTLEERRKNVAACKWVDGIVVNEGGYDSKPSILAVEPRFIAHGDDWTGEALKSQMGLSEDFLEANNIEMLYLPYTKGISTSEIIARVNGM